jgi:hypothetical protein
VAKKKSGRHQRRKWGSKPAWILHYLVVVGVFVLSKTNIRSYGKPNLSIINPAISGGLGDGWKPLGVDIEAPFLSTNLRKL